MKKVHLLIFSFAFMTNFVLAMNDESLIQSFAYTFPKLTRLNEQQCTSVASNGQSTFTASGVIYPENESDLLNIIELYSNIKKTDQPIRPLVIAAGSRTLDNNVKSGWSFDCHAHGHDGDIILNTSKLSGLYENIDWDNDFDPKQGLVKVWVYAGTQWGELVNLVNWSYFKATGDKQNYFVPIVSPTGSKITIGGSFASNTHSRATSIMGGYFADTADAFKLATLINGIPALQQVEKKQNAELFNALIGSFGRGGIVYAVKLNLQIVSQDKIATTKVRKVHSIEEMTEAFVSDRRRILGEVSNTNQTGRNAFRASMGIISEDFNKFFVFENDLQTPADKRASFPLYGAPNVWSRFIYKASRALPKLTDCLAAKYLDWQCAKTPCEFFSGNVSGIGEFHDHPLNNYIFFQDMFTNFVEKEGINFQTSHFTMMLRLENLGRAMDEIKRIKLLPEFAGITFELQDLLPVPATKVLMSPGYSPHDSNDVFITYTLSWSVDDNTRAISQRMEAMIEKSLFEMKVNGQPLAWLHPLKEFSFKNEPIEFYAEPARMLEEILQKYGIEDRGLFYSRIHDFLYTQ